MKKILMALVMCVLAVGAAQAFDKYTINREELPEAARNMLDEYFPKQ